MVANRKYPDNPRAGKRTQVIGKPFHYVSVASAYNSGNELHKKGDIWGYSVELHPEGGAFLRVFADEKDKEGELRLYMKSQNFKRAGNLGQLRMADGVLKHVIEFNSLDQETKAYLTAARKAISIAYEKLSSSKKDTTDGL